LFFSFFPFPLLGVCTCSFWKRTFSLFFLRTRQMRRSGLRRKSPITRRDLEFWTISMKNDFDTNLKYSPIHFILGKSPRSPQKIYQTRIGHQPYPSRNLDFLIISTNNQICTDTNVGHTFLDAKKLHASFWVLIFFWRLSWQWNQLILRVGLTRISSQLPVSHLGEWRHICHFFRWQKIWRVTFVTFLGRTWHSRTRKYFFQLVTFFVTFFPKNVTFLPRRYKMFLNGKKCDDSAGTETCFSLPVSDLSHISEAWSGKAFWAKTDN